MYFRIYNLSILKQIAIAWQSQQFNFEMPRQNRKQKLPASAGNRTRVTRVAGEYSTTRPPMLHILPPTLAPTTSLSSSIGKLRSEVRGQPQNWALV